MKILVTTLILLSFIGVGVFGFVAMQSKHGGDTFCLSDILNSSGCLAQDNTFSLSAILAAIISAIGLIAVFFAHRIYLNHSSVDSFALGEFPQTVSEFREQVLEFLTRYEKRDPETAQ